MVVIETPARDKTKFPREARTLKGFPVPVTVLRCPLAPNHAACRFAAKKRRCREATGLADTSQSGRGNGADHAAGRTTPSSPRSQADNFRGGDRSTVPPREGASAHCGVIAAQGAERASAGTARGRGGAWGSAARGR